MFQVDFQEAQQLLTVRFHENVDPDQMSRCGEEIKTLLADVAPGWRMLTDLSALGAMDPNCAPAVKTIMTLCNAKKVSLIVRVIPDTRKDIGYGLMTIFHYDRSVQVFACETLEEAHKLLASD